MLLLAYPRHEAILFHEVDLSLYDLDRRLYQSTPVALFRLVYTFERDRIGTRAFTQGSHLSLTYVFAEYTVEYYTCDFTSSGDWVGSGVAVRASIAH